MVSKTKCKLTPVDPILPVAPYLGGKRNLAKTICERIEKIPHTLYAEPFIGMGGVFLRRSMKPHAEVINDYSKDVSTLFRVLQRHYVPFVEMIRLQLASRAEFERLANTNPDTLTDLERSARFLFMQRTGFGGKVPGKANFGVSPDRPSRFDVTRVIPMLDDLHNRLSAVTIESLDFGEFITRYDRKNTLFYLDPPYWGCEKDYGKEMFSRADFERLRGILSDLKGRFIMSLNDVSGVRETFDEFDIETVETTYSISRGNAKRVGEVLISN